MSDNYFIRKYGGGQPAPVIAAPQAPYQAAQAAAELEGKRVSAAKARQDMQLDPQRIALDRQKMAIDAERLDRERQQSQRERALARAPLDALNDQLRRAWDLYAQGPGATPAWSARSLADFNPYSETNSRFNAAAAGIGEMGRGAFRVPGQGSQSDKELQAFIEANQPSASDTDAKIREKLGNLERRLGAQYRALGVDYKPYRPGTKPKGPPVTASAPRKAPAAAPDVQAILNKYGVR